MVAGAVRGPPPRNGTHLRASSPCLEPPLRWVPVYTSPSSPKRKADARLKDRCRSRIMAGPERISRERVMATNLAVDLKALIAGQVLDDPAARAERDSDFGRMIHRVPGVVVRPASTQDVAAVIRDARKNAGPLATRGEAHTQSGQATRRHRHPIAPTSLDPIPAIHPPRLPADSHAG